MAKFNLVPEPTFKAKVGIPVPGGKATQVEFVFRHKTKKQLEEFIASRPGVSDVDSVLAMASGWELAEEFNRDSVELLLENYIGAALAIYEAYVDALLGEKRKN